MGDDCAVIPETEIFALKEALHEQQQLLQKLYSELDAEREASASAASEALSMILRLQSEKAAIKMESEQYKRMSEHKICHAEESMAIVKDIIYHKEMEVEALEHQLQSYRYKLLSVGCLDAELRFSENGGETSLQNLIRKSRSISLPLKNDHKVVLDEQTGKDMSDQTLDSDKKIINISSGNIQSYWEQIRKLGNRVKELAANSTSESRPLSLVSSQNGAGNSGNLSNNWNRTRSPSPEMDVYNPTDSNPLAIVNETEEPKRSPSVHDVFEVPRFDPGFTSSKTLGNNKASAGSGKSGVIHPEEAVEILDHAMKSNLNWLRRKMPRSNRHKRNLRKRNRISFIDHSMAIQPGTCSATKSLPVSSQLNITSEITEVKMPALKESSNQEELVKLLHEIKEQVKSLHNEVWSWKEKKKPLIREEGVSLHSLQEAMLHFWF